MSKLENPTHRDRLWAWADVCLSGAGEYTPSLCALSLISDSTQYLVTRKFLHRFRFRFENIENNDCRHDQEELTKMTCRILEVLQTPVLHGPDRPLNKSK